MGTYIASKIRLAAALALSAWGAPALAEKALNMPAGVTELSVKIYDLHMEIFWWCVGIAVVVFGVMILITAVLALFGIARFKRLSKRENPGQAISEDVRIIKEARDEY